MENRLGKEIEQGFKNMAGGVQEAGRKRVEELVLKQGYVAFRNPNAVAQFHANPYYVGWRCECIDGEYRFYPPTKEKTIEQAKELQILETYKEIIKDPTKIAVIAISGIKDEPSKCKYELLTIDKRTGERKTVQESIVDFDGKFSMEIIPSLYNQLAEGFPADDYEKEQGITFRNIDNGKAMLFGNLSQEQLELIKNMKTFVDSKYTSKVQENSGYHR